MSSRSCSCVSAASADSAARIRAMTASSWSSALPERAQDVRPLLGLAQLVAGPPDDDVDLVRDVVGDELVDPQGARNAVDDGQHVGAEGELQLGVLVEVVEDDLGHRVALEHDDQALAGAQRALVADVGDAGDPALLDQVGDRQREVVGVDLVGQLGDDQDRPPLGVLLDRDHRAHPDRATTGAVGVLDPLPADDQATGREVRSLDPGEQGVEQLLVAGLGVLQRPQHAGGDLPQVVRRDVGGHADGDAAAAVDQQVGDPARQEVRLHRPAVIVRRKIDGFLVDLPEHLHRKGRHTTFRVAHSGSGVVSGRAEVAVAVDQRVAQRPGLGQAHEGVVDRAVAVRVVVGHHLADDAGALEVAAVGAVAAVVHGVEHPAVDRLEAVLDPWQGAADDDRHRVLEVGALHLHLDADQLDPVVPRRRRDGAGGAGGVSRVDHEGSSRHAQLVSEPGWCGVSRETRARPVSRETGARCRGSGRPWRCAG